VIYPSFRNEFHRSEERNGEFPRFIMILAKRAFSALLCFSLVASSAAGEPRIWFRTEGDTTLSVYLSTLNLCPLYGSGRLVEKISRLNPRSLTPDGKIRNLGAEVVLPSDERLGDPNPNIQILPSGEVRFLAWTPKRCLDPRLATGTPLPSSNRKPAEAAPTVGEDVAAPVPPMSAVQEGSDPESWIYVGGKVGYLRLRGRDNSSGGTATVLSDTNTGANLEWRTRWDDTWSSSFGFGLMRIQLLDPVGRTLDTKTTNLFDSHLGLSARVSPRMIWHLDLEMEQFMTFRSVSTTTLSLPKVSMPKAGSGLEFVLVTHKGLTLSFPIEVFYHFGAETTGGTFSSGLNETRTGLLLSHEKKGRRIEGGLIFRSEKSKSSLVTIEQTDLQFVFGLSWKLWD